MNLLSEMFSVIRCLRQLMLSVCLCAVLSGSGLATEKKSDTVPGISNSPAAITANPEPASTASSQQGDSPPAADNLSCDAIRAAVSNNTMPAFTPLETMSVQMGLYLEHHQYQAFDDAAADKTKLTDNKIGPHTLKWLATFCDALPESNQQNVIEELLLIGALTSLSDQCLLIDDLNGLFATFRNNETKSVAGEQLEALKTMFNVAIKDCQTHVDTTPYTAYADYYALQVCSDTISANCINPEEYKTVLENVDSSLFGYPLPTSSILYSYLPPATSQQESDNNRALTEASLKTLTFDASAENLFFSDCGCVQEEYFETHRYGVYPASELPKRKYDDQEPGSGLIEPSIINLPYDNFSRIAFDRLSVTSKGIKDLELWQATAASFIHEAHRHYTDVDLVLNFANWKGAKPEELAAQMKFVDAELIQPRSESLWELFASLTDDIDGLNVLFEQLSPGNADYKQWTPEGLNQEAIAHAGQINAYIASLNTRVHAADNPGPIPIITSINPLDISVTLDIAGCMEIDLCVEHYLRPLFGAITWCVVPKKGADACKDSRIQFKFVLLTLPQNAHQAVVNIGKSLADSVHGATHGKLLLSILPVLQPELMSEKALTSAVYDGKYLYGGNAYWPLTTGLTPEKVDLISEAVKDNDAKPLSRSLVNLSNYDVCKYVCAYREVSRVGFLIFALSMFYSVVRRDESCRIRILVRRYKITYAALWLVLFLLFLAFVGCDELFADTQEEILLVAFTLLILFTIVRSLKQRNKRPSL